MTALGTREAALTLATLPSATRPVNAHRLRHELIALADVYQRLVAIEVELRRLGMAASAHSVRVDARIVASDVCWRAADLGYGVVTVAPAAERAASECASGQG